MGDVREGGADFSGGMVVSVVQGLLTAGRGGSGEGVGDGAVRENGEVHDGCGGIGQVVLLGLPRALQPRLVCCFLHCWKRRPMLHHRLDVFVIRDLRATAPSKSL